jgi:hypothetical protein
VGAIPLRLRGILEPVRSLLQKLEDLIKSVDGRVDDQENDA